MEINKKEYGNYVKEITPVHCLPQNMLKAFFVGGLICMCGQVLMNLFLTMEMEKETASSWTTLCLIASSVVLTGLNIYPKIVKFGGAGALVPITGFANAVSSAAIEFKTEGFILGVGAKMFTIAGPVIVYGVSASVVYGLIYWICQMI